MIQTAAPTATKPIPRNPIQAVFVREHTKMAAIVNRQLARKIPLATFNLISYLTFPLCSLVSALV